MAFFFSQGLLLGEQLAPANGTWDHRDRLGGWHAVLVEVIGMGMVSGPELNVMKCCSILDHFPVLHRQLVPR